MSNILKWKGLEIDPKKIHESTIVQPKLSDKQLKAFAEGATEVKGGRYILPRIEAIHAGSTRNHTRYMEDKLKGDPIARSGVYSWFHPYPKPVIYNHDINTEATGRIYSAAFLKETKANRPGILVVPKITEEKAIQSVLDGRLLTVSIGATTDSAVCTICGTDIIEEGWCGHEKGELYDGHMCEWIIGEVLFDELSWVNVPADSDAMVVDAGSVQLAESFNTKEALKESANDQVNWIYESNESSQEEGELTLKTVEELKKALEALEKSNTELTAQAEQVMSEKSEKETQLEEANQKIQEQQAELEAKNQELTEKQAELETKVAELEESKAQQATAAQTAEELKAKVDTLEGEKETLVTANEELSANVHKTTAEHVVDIKVSLGRIANREEAVEQHLVRSTESLKDTLADLLKESSEMTVRRTPETAVNPANGSLQDSKEKNVVTGTVVESKPKTNSDIVMDLLKGSKNK